MSGITYGDGRHLVSTDLVSLYDAVGWTAYTRRPDDFGPMFDHACHVFSAWDGERLVGVVRTVGDGVTITHIQDLVVHPDYQRCGIGSRLLDLVLQATPDVRQTLIMTDAAPDNAHVVDFYRRKGFRVMPDAGCTGLALFR